MHSTLDLYSSIWGAALSSSLAVPFKTNVLVHLYDLIAFTN